MGNDDEKVNGASAGEEGRPGDDSIASLVRLAGPRPPVPREVRARVHESVKKEWRSATARRRALRWGVPAALAATLALAVILTGRGPLAPAEAVASVAMVDGEAERSGALLVQDDPVYPGDRISIDGRGLALAFDNGLSLRLAGGTAVTVDASDEITLASGKVYADTGSSVRAGRTITVHTGVASITDDGTQFAVAYDAGTMTVAVREGSVDVAAPRASWTADAGEKLTLKPGAQAAFETLPPHDESWDWAAALAPEFDIDDRPVIDFLRWVSRETGRELVFASDGVRVAAMATRLNGSVSGLTPSEAIVAIRPTIPRFDIRVEEKRMLVDLSR